MRNAIYKIGFLFLLLPVVFFASDKNDLKSELASVGAITISESEFLSTYSGILSKYGLNDSRKLRKETLNDLIRDKILYLHALETGLDITAFAESELERIR